ncbi:SRPBCC family protein [Streptomyces sp. NPDC002851]
MAVLNVHERLLPVEPEQLAPLIDGLSRPGDRLWPCDRWPAMDFDRPLGVGARGGHGPIGYTVSAYAPGQWVRFRFDAPHGFHGFHEFTLHPRTDGSGTVLRHTLVARLRGRMRLAWPLVFRWLHDALLRDAIDRAEHAVTGAVERPSRWSPYVRLLLALGPR